MTLIVSAASHRLALQVADTRLTREDTHEIVSDEACKVLVVRCTDADTSVAFSGTAYLEGLKVDDWLLAKLSFAPRAMSFGDLVIFCENQLNALRNRSFNFLWAGKLLLIFSGVAKTVTGAHLPALAHISNIDGPTKQARGEEPPGKERHTFESYNHRETPFRAYVSRNATYGILVNGSIDFSRPLMPFTERLEEALKRASGLEEGRAVLDELIAFIGRMRITDYFAKVIGDKHIGVVIDMKGQIECVQCGPSGTQLYSPSTVDKRGLEHG